MAARPAWAHRQSEGGALFLTHRGRRPFAQLMPGRVALRSATLAFQPLRSIRTRNRVPGPIARQVAVILDL
jgi:hypothetical protein